MSQIMKNGVAYAGSSDIKPIIRLTDAEYEALSVTEKNNGSLYMIYNTDPPSMYYMSVNYMGAIWG